MAIYCSEFDSGGKLLQDFQHFHPFFLLYSVQISEPAKEQSAFLSWKEELQILVKYVLNVNFYLLPQILFSTTFDHQWRP